VNGKQFPNEVLPRDMDHEKTYVMCSRIFFEGSGIHHSNSGHQMTYMLKVYFILLFVLTTDRDASQSHNSHQDNGNIRVELKFGKPSPDAITCLLYLEFDNSVRIGLARNVTTEF